MSDLLEKTATEGVEHLAPKVAEELDRLRIHDQARRAFLAETRPPVAEPGIATLRERLARGHPDLGWRIEGWQPLGSRVIAAAQFKAGKTTLSGNLARSLVDGEPFLGVAAVEELTGDLVILDFEMSERQLDGWLADQGIRNDDRVLPVSLRGRAAAFDILDPQIRDRWAKRLAGCEYLILDPLRPLLDALGLDEWRDAGRLLSAVDHLLADAGIPDALILHHMGHHGERSRGDSRLRDWPDVEWRLVREDVGPASARFISAYGRDVEIAESRLDFDQTNRRLTLTGGSRTDAKVDATLADIIQTLEAHPDLSGREIEEKLMGGDHSQANIRGAIKSGVKAGLITTSKGPRNANLHRLASTTPTQEALDVLTSELGATEVEKPIPF